MEASRHMEASFGDHVMSFLKYFEVGLTKK